MHGTKPMLPTLDELKEAGAPYGVTGPGIPKGNPEIEWQRSNPDVVVYLPRGKNGQYDGDNEHFLVFEAPKSDELLALWTQSSCEGHGDNHLMLARSPDGVAWSEPTCVAGTRPDGSGKQASWGFPVVADAGWIYIFYTKETEVWDTNRQTCGTTGCLFSDDNGHTWTQAADIPMPRTRYDNPDPKVPKNWIVWQKPIRDATGKWLAGYTLWTSKSRLREWHPWWTGNDSRCYFLRFENIDENPDPENLVITWLPEDEAGLTVPSPTIPGNSCSSEPCPVLLPDGRLLATMRTLTGFVWYSVSEDNGRTWRKPEPLRYKDGGEKVKHPLSPCPIYRLRNGRYLLVFHNNDGQLGQFNQLEKEWRFNHLNHIRNPTFIAIGEFRPEAYQPIWFSEPMQILDTDGVPVGPKGTAEIATYTSLTERKGKRTLWYPDRKHYLLGKHLPDELLTKMQVPEADM